MEKARVVDTVDQLEANRTGYATIVVIARDIPTTMSLYYLQVTHVYPLHMQKRERNAHYPHYPSPSRIDRKHTDAFTRPSLSPDARKTQTFNPIMRTQRRGRREGGRRRSRAELRL